MPAPVVLAAFGALLVSLDASLNIALPAVANEIYGKALLGVENTVSVLV